MKLSISEDEQTPDAKQEGRSLAKYLVENIMATIDNPDPLNSLIATITLVLNRIQHYNFTKHI
jgi:hypothetical protein